MPLGGYTGAGGTGRVVSRKQYKTCVLSLYLKVERDSHFITAVGSELINIINIIIIIIINIFIN